MKKKLIIGLGALTISLAVMPLFAAFEAHVINVTAKIENSLFVHPESKNFNTVFPQEYHEQSFFITVSESFSEGDQRRVLNIDYDIKQKPKPRPEMVAQLGGIESARDWCHTNIPDSVGATYDPNDEAWQDYLVNCYPTLCPYISKHPDNFPFPGNDSGLEAFHDPELVIANGKINKDTDPADQWIIDLAVPCFEGSCSQDWADFVLSINPFVQNPDDYMAPSDMNSEVFGCDLWVEVTSVY